MRSSYVLGSQICPYLSDGGAADREWLLTDGTGGYATGTAAGLRTRRMHAFLVTPAHDVADYVPRDNGRHRASAA